MELQNIGTTTTWNEAAGRINSNNQKIGTELMKLGSATYKNKGYFKTLSDLQSAFPTATVGSKAYVGLSYPYAIYLWENNSWVDSKATGGDDSALQNAVDLNTEQTIIAKKTFSAGINLNGTTISKVGSPVNTDDAANKSYVDGAVTTANAYIDKALKEHVVIFNGNNDRSEIIEAIRNNVPIVAKFAGGSSIGGMTIDSAQTAVATTFCDDGDTIELRFVLKNDSIEYFQVCYTLYPDAEEWIEDADVLATKDDLANKAEVFILNYDSSLEEVQNAYNKGYLIATYWQHLDKGTSVILFASSVMLNNDLGLEDFRPNILFNLIEDNGFVTEIYFNWSYDIQEWNEDHYQYKIPKLNEVVTLSGNQTITGEKKFSGGINMNGTSIRKLATPVNSDDAANKSYVDRVVSSKADIVDMSNYLEDGDVLPYPAAYRYGLNTPHFVSFRYYESDKEDWYIAFCMMHILPEPAVGYEFIFYKRDKTDNQYKLFKKVNAYEATTDATNKKWYNIGKKVFNEDLREGKQNKLTDAQIANINAVPNKVNLVEISGINNENSAGMSFPFPAMYSYYGGTLPHAAQFSQNGIGYVVLCLWHDASGTPASGNYALFKRIETNPAYIEFLRYVAEGDEFFTICQQQFHDDLPAKVTALQSEVSSLQAEVEALKAIINEITIKE